MSLFGSPSPQWPETKAAAAKTSRPVPFLDPSGFWVLPDIALPSGAFLDDPGGSGFTIIDTTTIVGLRLALLPNGFVITY